MERVNDAVIRASVRGVEGLGSRGASQHSPPLLDGALTRRTTYSLGGVAERQRVTTEGACERRQSTPTRAIGTVTPGGGGPDGDCYAPEDQKQPQDEGGRAKS
eukprot:2256828-Pyramimonas_sp.AAC.1